MNLTKKNFTHGNARFRGADGRIREAEVYSYETQKSIYDILIIEGAKLVRINGGQVSNMIDKWHPIHYAIEAHFELEKAGYNPSIHA